MSYTLQQANEYINSKIKRLGSTEANSFSFIMKRLEKDTIDSGVDAGRWIHVNVNGFVFCIHEDINWPLVYCLNSELPKKAKNKINTRAKRMLEANEREEYLDDCISYPYASGHMECVNRSTDSWEPTKRHENMVRATSNKWTTALVEIVEIAKANHCLTACKLLELMPELGEQIAPEFIFEEYSDQE